MFNNIIMLYGRWVPGISRGLHSDHWPLNSIMLSCLAIPACQAERTSGLTAQGLVTEGAWGPDQNPEAPTLIYPINKSLYTSRPAIIVTCLKHSVQKTTQSCNQNVPGTATLEHTSTMMKCTEPARLFKNTRKYMSSIILVCQER